MSMRASSKGSERILGGPNPIIFHVYPIDLDNKMKHVESEAEASHLAKSELEVSAKDPPESFPKNSLLEKENPKSLSASAVFQKKLFGYGFGCFVASTIDS
ncbi:unnamed protein product [Lactuca saligna]|uniref:Uncharacterized protein n=1 Tax=Lactuca saligna TaxID=75948 RepID=A0AA35ZS41_LACSI|nr:unnamed protein product [Lactuca saligna]